MVTKTTLYYYKNHTYLDIYAYIEKSHFDTISNSITYKILIINYLKQKWKS